MQNNNLGNEQWYFEDDDFFDEDEILDYGEFDDEMPEDNLAEFMKGIDLNQVSLVYKRSIGDTKFINKDSVTDLIVEAYVSNQPIREVNLVYDLSSSAMTAHDPQLSSRTAQVLGQNPYVRKINLANNAIGTQGALYLAASKTILELNVSNNQIGTDGIVALLNNSHLIKLDLSNNPVTDAMLEAIIEDNASHLEELDLSMVHQGLLSGHTPQGELSDVGLTCLTRLRKLKKLNLSGHFQITNEGLEKLLSSLPNLEEFILDMSEINERDDSDDIICCGRLTDSLALKQLRSFDFKTLLNLSGHAGISDEVYTNLGQWALSNRKTQQVASFKWGSSFSFFKGSQSLSSYPSDCEVYCEELNNSAENRY